MPSMLPCCTSDLKRRPVSDPIGSGFVASLPPRRRVPAARDPERLGRFEVEGQLDSCGLLDRQIGWFLAFENAPGDASLVQRIAERP
jgi:hypothetical protein